MANFMPQINADLRLSAAKLPVVAYRFNWTATHRLVTRRFLFLRLRLLIDKRIIVFVAACEVIRRCVAANVAIDA